MSEDIHARLNLDAEEAGRSVKDIKDELKEVNAELEQVKIGGKNFNILTKAAKKLNKELKKVKGEVAGVGDTAKVGFRDVTNSVTGGFAVATGAMALMGSKSESLGEIQKRVQAAIAIAVGVRNMQESKLNLTLIKRGLLTAKNKVWTLALAGAQKIVSGTTAMMGVAANVSSKGFKLLKIAIASTGIGLIVVGIGMLVAYWGDIMDFAFGTSSAMQDQVDAATAKKDAAMEELEMVEGSTNQMKLQGMTQKEILDAKVKAVEAALDASEAEMQAQDNMGRSQIATARRNKAILKGLLEFVTAPLRLILEGIDEAASWLGLDAGLAAGLDAAVDSAASMIFDPDEMQAEHDKKMKEMEKAHNQLKEKKAGLLLSIQEMEKSNAKKGSDQRKKEAAELRKLQEELALMELELDEERAVLKLEQQKKYDLEALAGTRNRKQQEKLINDKYNKLIYDAEVILAAKRKELAEETAKKIFEFLDAAWEAYDETGGEIKDSQQELNDAILEMEGETIEERQAKELERFEAMQRRRKIDLQQQIATLKEEALLGELSVEQQSLLDMLKHDMREIDAEQDTELMLYKKKNELELAEYRKEKQEQAIDASMKLMDAIVSNIDASMKINDEAMKAEIEASGATGEAKEKIEEKYAEKNRKLQVRKKAISAGQAIINTFVGASKALADLPPPASFIAMGATILAGLATVRQIYAQDIGGGKGGSTPSVRTPKAANQSFTLGGAAKDEPIKAFVVTDEMSNSQDQLSNIRRRATI